MDLNGREINFAYNMRAAKAFADFCPERNISKIGEALSGQFGNVVDNQANFILAMNHAYCLSQEHRGENLKMITMDELLDLDQDTFQAVFLAAAACMNHDKQTKVETKPAPRKKGGTQPANQS